MKKILDMLFIKNEKLDRDLFRALFYSFDNDCFAGFYKEILLKHQIYDSYKILKERITKIAENHNEYKYFIELDDKKLFIRIISDYEDMIYDILIYSILDNDTYNKYDRIFFPDLFKIPDKFNDVNNPIIYVDNKNAKLIKNIDNIISYLGYEDWDYKNKHDNNLEASIKDKDFIKLFCKDNFDGVFDCIKNGGDIIKLLIAFKFMDGYYLITNVKEIE
jgi:hypothetical protein